jgi:hypothetical protein
VQNGTTIKKAAIETVLEMGTTALSQATNMARILGIYYDGSHKFEEVVKRVQETEITSESSGSDSLAKFLIQFEKDHPLDPSST